LRREGALRVDAEPVPEQAGRTASQRTASKPLAVVNPCCFPKWRRYHNSAKPTKGLLSDDFGRAGDIGPTRLLCNEPPTGNSSIIPCPKTPGWLNRLLTWLLSYADFHT
jgi:hypothetical protein